METVFTTFFRGCRPKVKICEEDGEGFTLEGCVRLPTALAVYSELPFAEIAVHLTVCGVKTDGKD